VTVNAVVTGAEETPPIDDFPALQVFSDPAQGSVVAGAARVGGALRPYALRLRVENENIVEVERLLSGTSHGYCADVDQLLSPDVLYDAPATCGLNPRICVGW